MVASLGVANDNGLHIRRLGGSNKANKHSQKCQPKQDMHGGKVL